MFIDIIEGKAVVSEEAMSVPIFQKVYKIDKAKGKKSFDLWMRFVYSAYSKESIYHNYLPKEREKRVVENMFPDKSVSYFKGIAGMKQLIEFYIESTYTFKEKLYLRLLNDVEEMMERLSKIELTKITRVKGKKDITFYSEKVKEDITESIDIDVRISIDNSEEKIKAMDTLDKLLKRESVLKKALKEEQIEADLEERKGRLYDN